MNFDKATKSLHPFALRRLQLAKVSEISETTAAASVSPEERLNFHIGNPVQDARLQSLFARLILGLDISKSPLSVETALQELQPDDEERPLFKLLLEAAADAVTYLPLGGFSARRPGELAPKIHAWLTRGQPEALDYDLGTSDGRRELTFVSGGKWEALRLLFHVLKHYLLVEPASLHFIGLEIPTGLRELIELHSTFWSGEEEQCWKSLKEKLERIQGPHYLFLGRIPSERSRRYLRQLAFQYPLFIVELNNAPNHLSLAREAGLTNRVLRIFTPEAIDPRLMVSSLAFVAGDADYISALETVHFQLKGTPSATEVKLCAALLREDKSSNEFSKDDENPGPEQEPLLLNEYFARVERIVERLTRKLDHLATRLSHVTAGRSGEDPFIGKSVEEVVNAFFSHLGETQFEDQLEQAFIAAFLVHHPEYDPDACLAISGSARTALGLLSQACGIQEVIVPDLSWTYDDCFPRVFAVPLQENFQLDAEKLIQVLQRKLEREADWRRRGAVILNNPHNASGRIFDEEEVRKVLCFCLQSGVRVIDDLSYQNVVPAADEWSEVKTCKQLALDVQKKGYLTEEHLQNLITIQSISKTDSLAGARLAVIEIPDAEIYDYFQRAVKCIRSNHLALLIAYLFYRRNPEEVKAFWALRNRIMRERLRAIQRAVEEIPEDRNPYGIRVMEPQGALYPLLVVEHLPNSVSLDSLAIRLARQGVGLIPLSVFARTIPGFELGRKAYRLTLGGEEGADALGRKTRRLVINLNRMIAREAAKYNFFQPDTQGIMPDNQWIDKKLREPLRRVDQLIERIRGIAGGHFAQWAPRWARDGLVQEHRNIFLREFLPQRMDLLRQKVKDHGTLHYTTTCGGDDTANSEGVLERFAEELQFPTLEERQKQFETRLFDRTVHPTQMYALQVELAFEELASRVVVDAPIELSDIHRLARGLIAEYFGTNVALSSREEAQEVVYDLRILTATEEFVRLLHGIDIELLLSFWGDWDGSTRPSGQGHRLIAAALLENVSALVKLLHTFEEVGIKLKGSEAVVGETEQLEKSAQRVWKLLDDITDLTSKLEQRYLRLLPFYLPAGRLRRWAVKIGVAKDPLERLWQHNDRLERRMLHLRQQRLRELERYFNLNKRLILLFQENLDLLAKGLNRPQVLQAVSRYKNLLRRFVLTPRIHQRLITAQDQFAIDTTVHNMVELNRLGGQFGFPGLVLALQISMATDPEALIALDRKIRAKEEQVLREYPDVQLATVRLVPLFEDLDTICNIEKYLERVWDYAGQSRRLEQSTGERFREIICEFFIAGSDLSQQVSQYKGLEVYREAKFCISRWLTEKGLGGRVRIKFGSGEPPQRQGGYYDPTSGRPALTDDEVKWRLERALTPACRRAVELSRSPLYGILAGGEFRTFQSNLFERLRQLPGEERVRVFCHVREAQRQYEEELRRAAATLEESRLRFRQQGLQELELLTHGSRDPVYEEFLNLVQENFRQILYGRPEDLVGIHIISYFLARAMPALRDRPTVRPGRGLGEMKGRQIIEQISQTLPLSQHGSLLRAIGHNRAQTMVLGVNQLTTGLFRALKSFTGGEELLREAILPHLPVRDILATLRLYQDPSLPYVRRLENAFLPGNSALRLLREDTESIAPFVPELQRELLRRLGLDVPGIWEDGRVKGEVLGSLRPDLVVLLQQDLFNTDIDVLIDQIGWYPSSSWRDRVEWELKKRERVGAIRRQIWAIIEQPIFSQVKSFVSLAHAIQLLRAGQGTIGLPLAVSRRAEVSRLGTQVREMLRGVVDDSMRQFLIATVQYLTQLPEAVAEVPQQVVKALRDVERIVKIEEQALSQDDQARLRFWVLKMARLTGENG